MPPRSLAYLQDEPGGERVRAVIGSAVLSTVNWAEVIGKAREREIDTEGLQEDLESLGLGFEPFSTVHANIAGHLKETTRRLGLSLGDRALPVARSRAERSRVHGGPRLAGSGSRYPDCDDTVAVGLGQFFSGPPAHSPPTTGSLESDGDHAMRIEATNVHCLRISLPSEVGDSMLDVNHWDIVATEVITDTNLTGWGYNSTLATGSRALVSVLRDELAPRLIGQDPYLLKKIWKDIYLDNHFTGIYGIAFQGIAAIEIALWDLICKDCDRPLWKILGGFNGDRIPCYSTNGGWIGFSEQETGSKTRCAFRRRDSSDSR